jgi:hypothetical protein
MNTFADAPRSQASQNAAGPNAPSALFATAFRGMPIRCAV